MSVFSIPSPKPNLSRNGFDLSTRRAFHTNAGELSPIGCWEVNPSEHFEFRVQDLVRTMPLNTAAFARLKEYYHFFFVSYKSLWTWFDQFYTGVSQATSTLNGVEMSGAVHYDHVPRSVPYFYVNQLINELVSLPVTGKLDSQGYSYFRGACKLLNMLGYGCNGDGKFFDYRTMLENFRVSHVIGNWTHVLMKDGINIAASPFRLLAYQKIFNDFYRNQDWSPVDVASFNIDKYANDSSVLISPKDALVFCQLRYRPYSKDFLTSMKPTPQYDKGIFNLPSYVGSTSHVTRTPSLSQGSGRLSSGLTVGVSDIGGTFNGFTMNDLRAAFALDKMLEATRRANGLDYSSQIEAHFGFKVPDSRNGQVKFLGGFDNNITIGEVVSTSDSSGDSGAVLGDLAGKGIGSLDSGKIEYDVKEHGIIMCIHSVAPQVEYNASFFDPFNRKFHREDFFQPEFQDLGYQPVVNGDLLYTLDMADDYKDKDKVDSNHVRTAEFVNNQLLGYQVRYNEYKTGRDIVFGEFETSKSLSYWTTPRYDFGHPYRSSAPVSNWSSSHLYVSPAILNNIFNVSSGDNVGSQFLINCYFDVKAVRPMSVTGLSRL